ncbi:MAG: hypothetical protein IH797_04345 [Chloroflexi bacterium]|nr:hypothetical protein [Chloroflexota bacterium]
MFFLTHRIFKTFGIVSTLLLMIGGSEASAAGLNVGFYHSLIDWHHPEFPLDGLHPQRDDLAFREANKHPIKNVEDLESALEESDDHAVLFVQRGDDPFYQVLER